MSITHSKVTSMVKVTCAIQLVGPSGGHDESSTSLFEYKPRQAAADLG
jgi:hypothetical protein